MSILLTLSALISYELMKWEELQLQIHGLPITRELEWPTIAREIALMNKPYSSR